MQSSTRRRPSSAKRLFAILRPRRIDNSRLDKPRTAAIAYIYLKEVLCVCRLLCSPWQFGLEPLCRRWPRPPRPWERLPPISACLPKTGSQVSLKDFRGKWVVLYSDPKDFTTGCTIEAHNFQQDYDEPEYAKRNSVVIGVSVDSVDSHKGFCAKEGLSFKLLSDTDHKVVKQYGSTMTFGTNEIAARNTFIIDPQGKIVNVYTGVNPNKHSQEVLAALDGLQKAQ